MESPEITQLKKRLRYSTIIIAVLILTSVGFFFYGLINNIRMKQERQLAIEARMACEKISTQFTQRLELKEQELMMALNEARQAKDFALASALKAKPAEKRLSK